MIAPGDVEARIRAAFGRLGAAPHNSVLFDGIVQSLALALETPEVPPEGFRAKGPGQPKKFRADAVAMMAAYGYGAFTGRHPTIVVSPESKDETGPFVRLVEELFQVLGVGGKAAAAARRAVKGWRKAAQEHQTKDPNKRDRHRSGNARASKVPALGRGGREEPKEPSE